MATKKKPAKKAALKTKSNTVTKNKPSKKTPAKKAVTKSAPAPIKKERKATKPKNSKTLSYTQNEFIENMQAFCGIDKKSDAKVLCEDMSLFILDSLRKGYKLPLLGLGKLYVRKSKARMGRNPATGESIKIPAKKRVRFTAAKTLKETVL